MGRLIVVVIVLVAIAFLANKYILGEGDPRPAEAESQPAIADAGIDADRNEASDGGASTDPSSGDQAVAAGAAEAEPAAPITDEEGAEIAVESAAGRDASSN
jgi:hypothetical protein